MQGAAVMLGGFGQFFLWFIYYDTMPKGLLIWMMNVQSAPSFGLAIAQMGLFVRHSAPWHLLRALVSPSALMKHLRVGQCRLAHVNIAAGSSASLSFFLCKTK